MSKTDDFNNFRFEGLGWKRESNKYITTEKRVNDEEDRIILRINPTHLIKTSYGYAFILDFNHVVFLKDWQVSDNYYGAEVLLVKEYFKVKEWGEHYDFSSEEDLSFEKYLNFAKIQQEAGNKVKWQSLTGKVFSFSSKKMYK